MTHYGEECIREILNLLSLLAGFIIYFLQNSKWKIEVLWFRSQNRQTKLIYHHPGGTCRVSLNSIELFLPHSSPLANR